jgi:protein-S-isoprenylcysteine O-methyltransferase Ste14
MAAFVEGFAFPVLLLVLLILLLSGNFFSRDPLVIGGQTTGVALIITARISFGARKFSFTAQPADSLLILRGPYRYIRHPMYAGALLFVLATILGHLSAFTAILGFFLLILVLFRIEIEEGLLRSHYPEYVFYSLQTKKLIPYIY